MSDPETRIEEAAKQTRLAHRDLSDVEDELPEGLVDEIGNISERLRRVRHGLQEEA